MEHTFQTRQLTACIDINGKPCCLCYLAPDGLYLLESPLRKFDEKPFLDLHEAEKRQLAFDAPILKGFVAWYTARFIEEGTLPELESSIEEYKNYTFQDGRPEEGWLPYDESDKNLYNPAEKTLEPFLPELHFLYWKWNNYEEMILRDQLINPHVRSKGEFDYKKALFDTSDNDRHNILAPSTIIDWCEQNAFYLHNIDIDRFRLNFTMLPTGMICSPAYGWHFGLQDISIESLYQEDNGEDAQLPEELKNRATESFFDDYICSGFAVALLNLARNERINEFTEDYFFLVRKEPRLFPLRLEDLRFEFEIGREELFMAYYDYVYPQYRKDVLAKIYKPDPKLIDQELYNAEKRDGESFFQSAIFYDIDKYQARQLTGYYNDFMRFLGEKIGVDPDQIGEEQQGQETGEIPPEALPFLLKLQKEKKLDAQFQPADKISKPQIALIAHHVSQKAGIANKWVTFEKLWGKKNLAQAYQASLLNKKAEKFEKELLKILENT